jgi:oligopeptide/dipeptide ABC transporter ATP-binding protein
LSSDSRGEHGRPFLRSSALPQHVRDNSIGLVTATGDAQVRFTLKTPFGPFVTNLANNGEIVNRAAIESGDASRNPIGTGPFRFVEWVEGQHVRLEKNPDYFIEGKPYLDEVELRFLFVDQGRIDGGDWANCSGSTADGGVRCRPLFGRKSHPDSPALMRSTPAKDLAANEHEILEGEIPSLVRSPPGCPFTTRCPNATSRATDAA